MEDGRRPQRRRGSQAAVAQDLFDVAPVVRDRPPRDPSTQQVAVLATHLVIGALDLEHVQARDLFVPGRTIPLDPVFSWFIHGFIIHKCKFTPSI